MNRGLFVLAIGLTSLAFAGCSAIPKPGPVGNTNVPQPLKSVELNKYLGRWYEQFRYEASFQKDMDQVTADYSLNDDGSLKVVNRGVRDGKVKESTGKAKVVDSVTNAKLKVSFFGPFYGDYWVLDHADDYSWSIVGEPSGRYLWALTRQAKPSPQLIGQIENRVKQLGYDASLIRKTSQETS